MYTVDEEGVTLDVDGDHCVVIWGPFGPGMGRAAVYYGEDNGQLRDEELLEMAEQFVRRLNT